MRERAFAHSDLTRERVTASIIKDKPYPSSPLRNANSDATSKEYMSFRRARIFAALSNCFNSTRLTYATSNIKNLKKNRNSSTLLITYVMQILSHVLSYIKLIILPMSCLLQLAIGSTPV